MTDVISHTPETAYDAKKVALRAERGDAIAIEGFGEWTVAQRTTTFYGPKLICEPAEIEYSFNILLTAPGPGSQLQLWWPDRTDERWKQGWIRGPEVEAELVDVKQYDICPRCGEPLKTMEHERESAFGVCGGEASGD
jgi:hypothetical protein